MGTFNFLYSHDDLCTVGFSRDFYGYDFNDWKEDHIDVYQDEFDTFKEWLEKEKDIEIGYNYSGDLTKDYAEYVDEYNKYIDDELENYYITDLDNILGDIYKQLESIVEDMDYNLEFYDIELNTGYYEGFTVRFTANHDSWYDKEKQPDKYNCINNPLDAKRRELEEELVKNYLEKIAIDNDGKFIGNGGWAGPVVYETEFNDIEVVENNINRLEKEIENLVYDKDLFLETVQKIGFGETYKLFNINDKETILKAIELNADTPDSKEYTDDYVLYNTGWSDKDIVMAAINKDVEEFEFASPELQNDKDVANLMVEKNGINIQYLPEKFRDDKDIMTTAVSNCSEALKYASDRLKDDIDVVKSAYKNGQNRGILKYASERLQDNTYLLNDTQSLKDVIEIAQNRIKELEQPTSKTKDINRDFEK